MIELELNTISESSTAVHGRNARSYRTATCPRIGAGKLLDAGPSEQVAVAGAVHRQPIGAVVVGPAEVHGGRRNRCTRHLAECEEDQKSEDG